MATSGSNNFTETMDEIINDAFQLLGVYGVGRTVSAEDRSFAVRTLNRMIKSWSSKGLHLWAKEEGVLYITPNTAKYTLGDSASSARATTSEVVTQLSQAGATLATSLTVSSTTGMTIGDIIGVVLADNTIHWTTIATIPGSTSLTLTSGLISSANSSALVYTFTNRLYKPLRILDARYVTGFDNGATSTLVETPITSVAYQEYFELPVKTSGGVPSQFHYNPNNTSGDFYLWPRPQDGNGRIYFTYERIIENVDNASDNFDFPTEWLEPIVYHLAVRLGPAFGKDQRASQVLQPLAETALENLLNWDTEIDSISFTPDIK